MKGYIFWTISDNWEWADGYCPKFGLVRVHRNENLRREKRSSFDLFSRNRIPAGRNVLARPFCRSPDGTSSLDSPTERTFSMHDWRFKP